MLDQERKGIIKQIVKKVHEDPKSLNDVKERFQKIIRELTPLEIAQIEQEMIQEGISADTIHLMCDVHLEVFKEALLKEEIDVEAWHPINILVEEHKDIINKTKDLRELVEDLNVSNLQSKEIKDKLGGFSTYLFNVNSYFLKEENVLFPYLEKHDIVQPPAIMWKEHDQFRRFAKEFKKSLIKGELEALKNLSLALNELIINHVFKEHKILFKTALKVISEDEWKEIRRQFDEIGYFAYYPMPFEFIQEKTEQFEGDVLNLKSGYLKLDQLINLLNHLPVDITFIDENDLVKYFNESKERIFVRTRAVIGRKVQNCHPPKSIHIVNKILDDFKSGKRDFAEFWLRLGEKYVYIIYIAVRDNNGNYLGTLEVTQDILKFKNIEGEKRIYDGLEEG